MKILKNPVRNPIRIQHISEFSEKIFKKYQIRRNFNWLTDLIFRKFVNLENSDQKIRNIHRFFFDLNFKFIKQSINIAPSRQNIIISGSSGIVSPGYPGDRETVRTYHEKPVNIFQRIREQGMRSLIFRSSISGDRGIVNNIQDRQNIIISGSSGIVSPGYPGDRETVRTYHEKPVNIFQRIREQGMRSLIFRSLVSRNSNLIHDMPAGSSEIFRSIMNIYHNEKGAIYPDQSLYIATKRKPLIFSGVSNDIMLDSPDLIYKKKFSDTIDKTEKPHDEEKIIADKSEILKITSSLKEHVHDIGLIAEEVYGIIEKKIEIEKDRRGIF